MVIALAALMAGTAFIVLTRLLWLSAKPRSATVQPRSKSTIIALAAAVLVIGLGVLAATGKLHWLAAVGAALVPFLKRAFGLLRYLPPVENTTELAGGFTRSVGTSGPVSGAITAGSTWNFQAWHRDGTGDSNMTNAVSILFH